MEKGQSSQKLRHRKINQWKNIWLILAAAICLSIASCGSAPDRTPKQQTETDVSVQKEGSVSAAETSKDDSKEASAPVGDTAAGASGVESVTVEEKDGEVSPEEIPAYDGEPYVVLNDNQPDVSDADLEPYSYELYSTLDELDRCGETEAVIGEDLMPDGKRGNISNIKPTGWHSVQYDNVDGENLYNRCHLIGYQLTGENANECNLITGTRYMNVEGMLPFEDLVADYIRESGNHVYYRVTPIFEGDNLVASGVHMEAMSIEDDGRAICFNVYVYNVQPGIEIDYATGDSRESREPSVSGTKQEADSSKTSGKDAKPSGTSGKTSEKQDYVLNTNTKKFHRPSCPSADDMKPKNRKKFSGSREEAIAAGYEPCGRCHP